MIKSNPCKLCSSIYHTAAFCPLKPKKPIKKDIYKDALEKLNASQKSYLDKQIDKALKSAKSKVIKKKKPMSRSKLVKDLDSIFSWYIRLRHAVLYENDLMATCVTCNDVRRWQDQQNGHFYTRGRQATRWNEMNCNVQCMRCNVFLKGNYIPYTKYMIDTHGREAVDELERLSTSGTKISSVQLQDMIASYKAKVDEILKRY